MKCWSMAEMEEHLINKQFHILESHISHCASCAEKYRRLLEEQSEWSSALYSDSLPSTFTDEVIISLRDPQTDVNNQTNNCKNSNKDKIPVKTKLTNRWIAVAATLVLLCGSLLYASPSIAEMVRSMFAVDAPLDPGLQQAQKLGLIQDPKIDVRDQGYRIQVNEVSADRVRLTFAVKVTDTKGNPVVNGFSPEQLTVKDDQGNSVGILKAPLGTSNEIDKFTYIYQGEITSPTLTVWSDIDKINNTKGNWKFSFPVDLSKADSLTKVDELNEHYTTQEGLNIQMKKLTHTPSGVKLEFTTSLNGSLREMVPADMEQLQTLKFHFEDEEGHSISQVNEVGGQSMLAGETSKQTNEGIHWAYTFIDLPYDTKQVKFVLDGYSMPEKSEGSLTINPSSLSKGKELFHDSEDKIWFKSFKLVSNQGTTNGMIGIQGQYMNVPDPSVEKWHAVDEEGKNYQVEYQGSIDQDNKIMNGYLIVKGLSTTPHKLTLSRTIVNRYYKAQWSYNFPRGERIPGLENNKPMEYWK